MPELTDLSLSKIVQALHVGDFSSRDITQAFLNRISRLESKLHAFITVTPDIALSQADAADRQFAAWRKELTPPPPPLLGVPIAVKDVLCVADVQCTCGSRILENFVPPFNASDLPRLIQ